MSNKKIQEINDKLLWFINGFIVLLEIIMTIGCIAASVFILARDVFNVDMKEFKADFTQVLKVQTVYSEEVILIAKIVECESGNQNIYGQKLVADTVLNRVDNPSFPDSVREVIEAPKQYSVVQSKKFAECEPKQETLELVAEEFKNRTNDEVIYFCNSGYVNGTPWKQVQDHYFSTK